MTIGHCHEAMLAGKLGAQIRAAKAATSERHDIKNRVVAVPRRAPRAVALGGRLLHTLRPQPAGLPDAVRASADDDRDVDVRPAARRRVHGFHGIDDARARRPAAAGAWPRLDLRPPLTAAPTAPAPRLQACASPRRPAARGQARPLALPTGWGSRRSLSPPPWRATA